MFTGELIAAIIRTAAFLLALFICLMCVSFYRLCREKLGLSALQALGGELFFLLLFFLIFRNRAESRSLFQAANLSCIYYYTISGITNGILILTLLRLSGTEDWYRNLSIRKKVLLALLVYAAVFSNLFHSAMTAVFCFSMLVTDMLRQAGRDKKVRRIIPKGDGVFGGILAVWAAALLFELSGERASQVGGNETYSLLNACRQLMALVRAISKPYLLLLLLCFVSCIAFWLRNRSGMGRKRTASRDRCSRMSAKYPHDEASARQAIEMLIPVLLSLVLLTAFLLVLNGRVAYMSRLDASFGIWFMLNLAVSLTMISVVRVLRKRKSRAADAAALAGLCLCAFCCWYPDGTYMISTTGEVSLETCHRTDRYVMDSLLEADRQGLTHVTVAMPDHRGEANAWATDGIPGNMENALYNWGVIRTVIPVTVVYDPALNELLQGS